VHLPAIAHLATFPRASLGAREPEGGIGKGGMDRRRDPSAIYCGHLSKNDTPRDLTSKTKVINSRKRYEFFLLLRWGSIEVVLLESFRRSRSSQRKQLSQPPPQRPIPKPNNKRPNKPPTGTNKNQNRSTVRIRLCEQNP
jgi:hypothetical protein